jgi:hypothetical protein
MKTTYVIKAGEILYEYTDFALYQLDLKRLVEYGREPEHGEVLDITEELELLRGGRDEL